MLTDLNIKPGYNSDESNLIDDFYNPCLSESMYYDRVAGYFSSNALKYLTKGIESLIAKRGKYRLIISQQISEQDYNSIKEGYFNRNKLFSELENHLDLDKIQTNLDKQKFSNLAYLIEIGLVDIKIGFTHSGIFHAKFGILTDSENNYVYFSGSANETENAFAHNFENIDIKKSWVHQSEENYILDRKNYFESLWTGSHNSNLLFVTEINDFIKFKLKEFNKGELIIDKEYFEKNALILVFQDTQLKIINNLASPISNTRYFKKLYQKFNLDKNTLIFPPDITYNKAEEIIISLQKHEDRSSQKVVITKSVLEMIDSQKFEIHKVAHRGLLIKSQDNNFIEYVNHFNQIVDHEFSDGYSLRGVQKWVSYYMTRMKRVANFSVPGSGKTAMVYGAFAYLSSQGIDEVDQIIMIGPKNSFLAWKEEFNKFFNGKRELNMIDIHDSNFDETQFVRNPHSYNLILINYESLKRYMKYLKGFLNTKSMLVFDEVHKVKRIDSQRAADSIQLAALVKYRFVLTGTPIPNSYSDIWNFLHILYDNEYNEYFGLMKPELANADLVVQEKINDKLAPFFWRVTKNDLNVPPANEDFILAYNASDQEQFIINLLWKKYRRVPFKLYIRLIQFSSNPTLLAKSITKSMFYDNYSGNDYEDSKDDLNFEFINEMEDNISEVYTKDELELIQSLSTTRKFEAAINKIDELVNQNKTVIVWCIFVDTINKVVQRCQELGHRVNFISGSVDEQSRENIIKKFQNGEINVLVTNPHTLAESVSLHKACHDAIYLEYSFNLTHMLQSRDRIHRLGLTSNDYTSYYYFMLNGQEGARNTIDSNIYTRLKEKEQTMLEAIEGGTLVPEYSESEKEEILNFMNEEIDRA